MERNVLYLRNGSLVGEPCRLAMTGAPNPPATIVYADNPEQSRLLAARSPTGELPFLAYEDGRYPGALAATLFMADLLDLIPPYAGPAHLAWLAIVEICITTLERAELSNVGLSSAKVADALVSIESYLTELQSRGQVGTDCTMVDICIHALLNSAVDKQPLSLQVAYPRAAQAATRAASYMTSGSKAHGPKFDWMRLGSLCTSLTC